MSVSRSKGKLLIEQSQSYYQNIKDLWFDICSLGVLVYLSFHFIENPPVIATLMGIITFVVLAPRREYIRVYSAGIEFGGQNRYIKRIRRSKFFHFSNIETIHLHLPYGRKQEAVKDAVRSVTLSLSMYNTVDISFINGKSVSLVTHILREYLGGVTAALQAVIPDKMV